MEFDPKVKFTRVLVKNADASQGVSDVKMAATLGG